MPTTDTPIDVIAVIKAVITTNFGFCEIVESLMVVPPSGKECARISGRNGNLSKSELLDLQQQR